MNHYAKFNDIVIHFIGAGLDDKYVLASDRNALFSSLSVKKWQKETRSLAAEAKRVMYGTDFNACFFVTEFLKGGIGKWSTQSFAHEVCQLWVRGTSEDLGVAKHVEKKVGGEK